MSAHLSNSLILDGYRLIRFLGQGGFGEVWLCRSESMGDYRALKFIPTSLADRLEKEYEALLHFRKAAARLRSPHLVSIEHVGHSDTGLYYVMPLADGDGAVDSSDPAWAPMSLTTMIQGRAEMHTWFSSREIIALIQPILEALQTLSDAGLVHRDVKPDNILFFNGQPCLADISLLGADASVITRRGTPGYATPSWYEGGHPDMYGVAATLYSLLTGNSPDKMGRSAFTWPLQGEISLPKSERFEWKRLHGVIRRATAEQISERYIDFRAMALAIHPVLITDKAGGNRLRLAARALSMLVGVCLCGWWLFEHGSRRFGPEQAAAPAAIVPANSASTVAKSAAIRPIPVGTSQRFEDGSLASNALAAHVDDPDDPASMSFDENKLYQDTLGKIQNCIWDENELDFETAIRFLDECVKSIPRLEKRPNIRLARLLLQRCADGLPPSLAAIEDPSLLVLGNDELWYRVALLCHLGAAEKAEEFLVNYITSESRNSREKSKALIERARVRAELGKFADARTDAEQAITQTAGNSALKAQRQTDLIRLESDVPAYAKYLKSLQEE